MTTVAWDGEILAADGRITCGTVIECDNYNKIFKLHDISYYGDTLKYLGIAGSVNHVQAILHNLHIECFVDNDDEARHAICGIIVGTKSVYILEEETLYLSQFDRKTKLAVGSGGECAKSAMALGLDAKQAVKHAMKFDVCTGGRIRSARSK
tara:strand:+ start:7286 stop:7741 length:456 start_codon:yes stop_codon:yes gene_type:complete